MAEPEKEKKEGGNALEALLGRLSEGLGQVLEQQKSLGDRLARLETRLENIEEEEEPPGPAPAAAEMRTYDYRVLHHSRCYTVQDIHGRAADMVSVRRCLALQELAQVRTRYHTGTGEREVRYAYRIFPNDNREEPPWTPVEYHIDKGAGADFSAFLMMPEPVHNGDVFELRHEIRLHNAFTGRNEWVTLVVEYPTEVFRLEVILPPGRRLVGARREESEGASNSFNKRRVFPRTLSQTGQISLLWEEERPVTGRAYTLFWDW
ncbi:MAG: hypothetical protein HYZ11_05705 [Candidatus Tectomicrobia bacterium]|uniref:Uncharacterized protein n=1 Tax=Tectimicrobiota bacterium TaxID=2528274 RepID=A0A932MMU6_UNCTE|nr:hypothetical protein [Candidatus Tectomicrobia bacterium]